MAVYKRGAKGVFYMNFTVNGVRVYRSTGMYTKKEAKMVETIEKKKMMDYASLSPKERKARMMLSDAIKKVYSERWKENKDGRRSLRNAEIVLEIIGDMHLNQIDEDVVADLVVKLQSRKVKPGTVNRFLAALKTVLRHNRQAWDHIKLKKEAKGRIRVLTYEEQAQVVRLLRSVDVNSKKVCYSDVADLIEVLVDTGCRLSEVLRLQYKDVNFNSNLISIWINKGEKPRSMPMTSTVRKILLARCTGDSIKPFDITIDQAERGWRWAREVMGLKEDKEFVIHALRHTCASRLVNAGVDLYVVKEWLGHSSIQITEKYAHLSPQKLAHAALLLEQKVITVDADIDADK